MHEGHSFITDEMKKMTAFAIVCYSGWRHHCRVVRCIWTVLSMTSRRRHLADASLAARHGGYGLQQSDDRDGGQTELTW